jgi:hypothetical protein
LARKYKHSTFEKTKRKAQQKHQEMLDYRQSTTPKIRIDEHYNTYMVAKGKWHHENVDNDLVRKKQDSWWKEGHKRKDQLARKVRLHTIKLEQWFLIQKP